MRFKLPLALLFTLALSATGAGPFIKDGHLEWLKDERAALAQAKALHRPMVVDFYADWCSSCMELDRKTYVDPRVRDEIASRFVPLKVDCTDDTDAVKALEKKYGVDALPTVLFLDSEGHPMPAPRITEFENADAFLAHLTKVR